MSDKIAFEVAYTEAIVRDAVRTYVWQRVIVHQKGLWIAELVVAALLAWLLLIGEQGWAVIAVGIAVLAAPCLIVMVWWAHHQNTVGKFRRMPTPTAQFSISGEGLEVKSHLGAAQMPWSSISEIWERPTYWMMFTGPNQFLTLPIESTPEMARSVIRTKVRRTIV